MTSATRQLASAKPTSTTPASTKAFELTTFGTIAVTIVAWASAFPAIRAGLQAFSPLELGAIRFTIAAIPAAAFLLITRPPLPRRRELLRFGVGGLFFVALYTVLLNFGEISVSAGAASFIINTSPIMTAILATVFLGETFSRQAWLGTALSFTGITLIAIGENGGTIGGSTSYWGALLILGSALCASIATVVQKPLLARHKPLTVSVPRGDHGGS